jgi:hypothetical protein
MECTALDVLIGPASVTSVCALLGCWLVAALAHIAKRLTIAVYRLLESRDFPLILASAAGGTGRRARRALGKGT